MPATKNQNLNTLLVRKPTICSVTAIGSSTIDLWAAQGRFPAPLYVSDGVKIWVSADIRNWIREHAGNSPDNNAQNEPCYSDDQLLTLKQVSFETTLGESTIRLWVKQGRFPAPIKPSSTKSLWRYGCIKSWASNQVGCLEHMPVEDQL